MSRRWYGTESTRIGMDNPQERRWSLQPGDERLRPNDLQLMVLVGLQASGKTLFTRRHLAAYVHISKDHWPNAQHKAARQARAVDEALALDRSVAVDNTNPTVEDRRPLLEAARAHHADPIALVFRATVRECLIRNARRQGRARVPDVAILATAKRLQRPTREEGFCCCYEVRLEPDGTFVIRQLPHGGIQEWPSLVREPDGEWLDP
jgi:predicted kinase